ncbi:MAG: hypothetical protein HYY58_02565 [Candidatus Omnitrophica bacterium]|nr:hypothetical protein [Candidatus Omnitrophota bacterium]
MPNGPSQVAVPRDPSIMNRLLALAAAGGLVFGSTHPVAVGDAIVVKAPLASPPAAPIEISLSELPAGVKHVATFLQRTIEAFHASTEASRIVKQLRADQDAFRTRLAAIAGELEVLGQDREQLQQELSDREAELEARLESLRKELEAKLDRELSEARRQMDQELEQDVSRQVQSFEARQRQEISEVLGQEVQLQERALQQLRRELELQTEGWRNLLERLEVKPELVNAAARSAEEALAKRASALETRRRQLQTEQEARLAQRSAEFMSRLKEQRAVERQRRLTVKEAALRHAMAELLQNTRLQAAGHLKRLQEMLEEVKGRYGEVAQERSSLRGRLEVLDKDLVAKAKHAEELETQQQTSVARLEQALLKSPVASQDETLAWFGRVAGRLPPDLAGELGSLQQRLADLAQQARQLKEQQRALRERQLAMELSREMEAQRQEMHEKERRAQEARSRKADELLVKAKQLSQRGRFDEALRLVSEAHAINPPELSRVMEAREELLAAQAAARASAEAAELERLFARAMEAFQQGRYEDAIPLFERVITLEAAGSQGSGARAAEEGKTP